MGGLIDGKNFDGVILDLDGVVIDSEPIHKAVFSSICEQWGPPVTWDEFGEFIGKSVEYMWSHIVEKYSLDIPVSQLADHFHAELAGFFRQNSILPPMDGIPELLDLLAREQIACAIGSSSSHKNIEMSLAATGLSERIPKRVSGEDVRQIKPAPDIFLLAARRMGVAPDRCLVIEDSAAGIQAAISAGMQSVGFISPHSGQQDLSGATIIVQSLRELATEVER